MATLYGIIVGRRDAGTLLADFRRLGHVLVPLDPARGTHAVAGRHARGRLRIHDDAAHFTWRSLCPVPHSILEAEDDPELEGSLRRTVAAYGGFVREPLGALSPAPTPEGENPDYDLIRSLSAVEGLSRDAANALVALARSDPDAFRAVGEALRDRADTPVPPTP